ncbi:MAG TPA: alpha/beta hydrolase [Edaphobacter sp.]|nr:alpha/beta hydrolase [Edaphobacter sp.]
MATLFLSFSHASPAQDSLQGASYPAQQFVTVAPDVKLEILDWGGSGRNLVLLAGGGNTAHVYASLAPKLAKHFHVYGITRRGAGESSAPPSGYTARQFGDDVVAVLDALHLLNPVLVGHSIAGEEMSSVSEHHPGRVSAMIYLDAGGPFALYNPEHGDIDLDRAELQKDLSKLGEDPYDDALITKTLTDAARYRRNLQDLRDEVEGAAAPAPTKADLSSIAAFQRYFAGYYGGMLPEEEIRQHYQIKADGSVGDRLTHPGSARAKEFEYERFSTLETRALVIIPYPDALNSGVTHDPAKLAAYKAQEASRKQGQLAIWRKQPNVEVVVVPNVTHYIFLSDEDEIISLISRFVHSLPS